MDIAEKHSCRNCGSELESVLDLGNIYPSNFVATDYESQPAPLHVVRCKTCDLVQLKHTLNLDSMYRNYWYRSSANPSMMEALKNVIYEIKHHIDLKPNDVVLDIGCNDGTLLSFYPDSVYKVGYDPALNLSEIAKPKMDLFINDYFDSKQFHIMGKAKVVTSIAMFYDLERPNQFIRQVKEILHYQGIWVIQFTDLISMLRLNAFDNICHEHLEYYSLQVLVDMLYQHGLDVYDVDYNTVNGGSVRAYVCHLDQRRITNRVVHKLKQERVFFNEEDRFTQFNRNIHRARSDLREYLRIASDRGKTIYGLGASTKGNTLLQYFRLTSDYIKKIGEINREKVGLKTVGSNIPIISEFQAYNEKPDGFVILPWHFKDVFIKKSRERGYFNRGGHLIFPLPELEIVTK